jgi:lycopene beta-cyclase
LDATLEQDGYDVIFAGGGLSSALTAYRLHLTRPDLRLAIVESGPALGGNHTWSFHHTDLTGSQRAWLAPFIAHRWDAQAVRFPDYSRVLPSPYYSVTSQALRGAMTAMPAGSILLNAPVARLEERAVHLDGGRRLRAPCIIDGRGHAPSPSLALGFQKFLGVELRCREPHGETAPVIMDASVRQDDGYRFVYTLPLSADRLLIEDTYYADGAQLDINLLRNRIAAYAAARGWRVAETLREETGVLPVILGGNIDTFWSGIPADSAPIGLRAALFHPTTGYSLPDAVRLADDLAALPSLTTRAVRLFVEQRSKRLWRERAFYRMLNRMLFLAAEPAQRYAVLQRFYRLPEALIARFYAAASTGADKARILIGRPPVSIRRALASLPEASAWPADAQCR